MILLDALDPGSPAQLVTNCQQAAAAGALGYVWHGSASSHDTGTWTRAHFDALLAAGLITAPIASCSSPFPTPETIVAAAQSFGFTTGPLFQDMEGPANLPPQSWWDGAIPVYRGAGFLAVKYGNAGDVGAYALADGWWKAAYIQNTVKPAPALPAGLVGWQYANLVNIGGVTYDASTFDPAIFQEVDMTPEEHAWLQYCHDVLVTIDPNNAGPGSVLDLLHQINAKLDALAQSGGGSGGLTAAQAAQLSDIQARVTKIQTAMGSAGQ